MHNPGYTVSTIEKNARIIQHAEFFSLPGEFFFVVPPDLVAEDPPEASNSCIKC